MGNGIDMHEDSGSVTCVARAGVIDHQSSNSRLGLWEYTENIQEDTRCMR